ncbi:ribokinase [Smaragdicoccus niigatensis]|uniref:ribokinase n=1 Tax=Smaragdicoccus niigatensis TaxID=359359 RepID=UPI000380F96E
MFIVYSGENRSAPGAEAARPESIIVLGSVNMDLIVVARELPRPGETMLGQHFRMNRGGKGANQAIAAARCGAIVTFLGAVGQDHFAEQLRHDLFINGIEADLVRDVDGTSGVAIIVVDEHGENRIIVVGDANSAITGLTTPEKDAIAKADILMLQLELPIAASVAAAREAHAHGTMVFLNPSPVQPIPGDLLDCIDVLVLNEPEAQRYGDHLLDSIPHVIITKGAAGCVYRGPEGQMKVPAFEVEAVDTTGAGDAFVGALAATWSLGPDEALRWASAAGALSATHLGAYQPTREQLEAVVHGSF